MLAQLCRAVEVGEAAVAATETAEPGGGGEDGGGAGEELGEAMRCLDMCSIMGAPAELVQEFAGVVEPLLRARLPPYRLACGALTLPAALPPELVPERRGAPVARVEAMPVREFRKKHFKLDVPVVITGAARDWPALRKWRDLHALAGRYGHRHVPLEVGDYDDAGWREEVMPFGRFIDRHLGPPPPGGKRPPVGYLAQHHLFEQFPELLEDFGVPDYCEAGGGCQKCNAWVGPAGTVTPLHFDSYDNLLTQICGYKYVKLYSQKDSKYREFVRPTHSSRPLVGPALTTRPAVYRSKAPWTQQRTWPGAEEGAPAPPAPATAAGGAAGRLGAQGNISLVDVDAPDHVNDDKFPLFKHATLQECLLGPGDMLYIPNRYWHHVRSLTTSISVNFLF